MADVLALSGSQEVEQPCAGQSNRAAHADGIFIRRAYEAMPTCGWSVNGRSEEPVLEGPGAGLSVLSGAGRLTTYQGGTYAVDTVTGVYYAAVALARIDEAQRICDEHVVSAWTGRCLGCDRLGPCSTRLGAEQRLKGYRRLPQRRPGASLHGYDNWPHLGGRFNWFAETPEDHR